MLSQSLRPEDRAEGGKGGGRESFAVQRTIVKGVGGGEANLRTVRGCFHTVVVTNNFELMSFNGMNL